MTRLARIGHPVAVLDYIRGPNPAGFIAQAALPATTTVELSPVSVPFPVVVDALIVQIGGTSSGNIRIALYGPVALQTVPDGAPLQVDGGSVASPGASRLLIIPITPLQLAAGVYWFAFQADNTSVTMYLVLDNANTIARLYTSSGYAAYPSTVPVTSTGSRLYIGALRVKTNLPM